MADSYAFSHVGGHRTNCDRLFVSVDEPFFAALCDGLNGMPSGDLAAEFVAGAVMDDLKGADPESAVKKAEESFKEKQKNAPQLSKACTTVCALKIEGGKCRWATSGDSRIYHFSDGRMCHVSRDDTYVYGKYESGEISYEDIRLDAVRSNLSACIGHDGEFRPNCEEFDLKTGDRILMCSDGFWQYVFETEMEIDISKTATSREWVEAMLLRLTARSMLDGDNISVLAYVHKGDDSLGL